MCRGRGRAARPAMRGQGRFDERAAVRTNLDRFEE